MRSVKNVIELQSNKLLGEYAVNIVRFPLLFNLLPSLVELHIALLSLLMKNR